jgi:AtzE family amidohydrolase
VITLDQPGDIAGACAIADAVRRGDLSAVALIESRLERIQRLNPRLNCFTEVLAERALRMADAIDAMVAEGRDPGPLAGVPFGVKDNYDIVGRITTAGSIINRTNAPAKADALLLQRAARAGAVLVGAQNMDEFAYGFTTENAHYGATRNPRDTARSAGGSSGGSAAAVAAGLTEFSLGTDTNGSVRVPASFCGIFGLKPTFGRLPRTGTFPFVHDLDHLGPFARSTADLAAIYDVLQGYVEDDAGCVAREIEITVPHLKRSGTMLSVAVLDGWFHDMADDQGRAAVDAAARGLNAQARIALPGSERARAAAFVLTAASGGNLHIEALRTRADQFDPATRDRLLAGALVPANLILQAQRVRHLYLREVLEAFRHHDLLLAPATPCHAPLLGQPTIRVGGKDVPTRPNIGVLTQPLSFVGLPIVTVPVQGTGLPIGVQIIAPPWREDAALAAASRLEASGVASAPMAEPW